MIISRLQTICRLNQVSSRLSVLFFKKPFSATSYRTSKQVEVRFTKEALARVELKLQHEDRVSNSMRLIYRTQITNLIKYGYRVTVFLFISLCIGYYQFRQHELEYPLYEPDTSVTIWSELEAQALYIMLLIYNIIGLLYLRRHVLRIWYNAADNSYKIILPSFLPTSVRHVVCRPGDVYQRFPNNKFPIIGSQHVIHGWSYYMNGYNFVVPSDYQKIIGEYIDFTEAKK